MRADKRDALLEAVAKYSDSRLGIEEKAVMHRIHLADTSLYSGVRSLLGRMHGLFEEPHPTLHALCASGDATPGRIKRFLDLGIDVNAAAEVDLVTLGMMHASAPGNSASNADGMLTPLQLAAMECRFEAVRFLIEAGADIGLDIHGPHSPRGPMTTHGSRISFSFQVRMRT